MDRLEALEARIVDLGREISTHKSAMDLLSLDCKSLNTSLQNTLLSFGSLKEKTDTVFSSMRLMSDDKDDKIKLTADDLRDRSASCRALCDNKLENIEFRVESVRELVTADISAVQEKLTVIDSRVSSIENKIETVTNWLIGTLLTSLAGLAYLLADKVGWLDWLKPGA